MCIDNLASRYPHACCWRTIIIVIELLLVFLLRGSTDYGMSQGLLPLWWPYKDNTIMRPSYLIFIMEYLYWQNDIFMLWRLPGFTRNVVMTTLMVSTVEGRLQKIVLSLTSSFRKCWSEHIFILENARYSKLFLFNSLGYRTRKIFVEYSQRLLVLLVIHFEIVITIFF